MIKKLIIVLAVAAFGTAAIMQRSSTPRDEDEDIDTAIGLFVVLASAATVAVNLPRLFRRIRR